MKLIVGLGNPGRTYARHRHNIGFMVADLLAERHEIALKKKLFDAITGKGEVAGVEAMLVQPQTYMNRAGYAVGPLIGYYKCAPHDMVVVHDDIDLDLGRIKIVMGAGHGGHNGVRSIIEELGVSDFYRLRLGVGRPPAHMDPADYVLQPFAKEERAAVEAFVARAADAVEDWLTMKLADVQQKYH